MYFQCTAQKDAVPTLHGKQNDCAKILQVISPIFYFLPYACVLNKCIFIGCLPLQDTSQPDALSTIQQDEALTVTQEQCVEVDSVALQIPGPDSLQSEGYGDSENTDEEVSKSTKFFAAIHIEYFENPVS